MSAQDRSNKEDSNDANRRREAEERLWRQRQSIIRYCDHIGRALERQLAKFFICRTCYVPEANRELVQPLLNEMATIIMEHWRALYQAAYDYPEYFPDVYRYLLL